MYHSVTFGNKNSWEDWHLVPSSRPVINPPEAKTQFIDIPGMSGVLDVSQSLSRYPLFKRRTGDIEFIVVNDFYEPTVIPFDWSSIYSEIMNYLHNREMEMVLEDDPDWWYEGRFQVNSWKSEEFLSRITISYDLEPYKWYHFAETSSGWKDKVLNATTTSQSYTFNKNTDHLGEAPTTPKIIVSGASTSGVEIHFVNNSIGIDVTEVLKNGAHEPPRIIFYGNNFTMYYKSLSGTATITVKYQKGSL